MSLRRISISLGAKPSLHHRHGVDRAQRRPNTTRDPTADGRRIRAQDRRYTTEKFFNSPLTIICPRRRTCRLRKRSSATSLGAGKLP